MSIRIHPNKYLIYGWENPRSIENVISIMRGIIDGNKIPKVILDTFDGGLSFEIAYKRFGIFIAKGRGGHHRLIGTSLLDCKLDVIIASFDEKGLEGIPNNLMRRIKDVKLASKPDIYLKSSKKHPLPTIDEFFTKYKEINRALKHGAEDYSFTRREYKELLENLKEEEIPF